MILENLATQESREARPAQSEQKFRLRMQPDGRLWLKARGTAEVAVTVRRCFPWSQPLAWLSLRDDSGAEVELVESAAHLDPESRAELVKALEEASFVFVIEAILSVKEEFELRQWRVRTTQGERLLQTRMMSWPRELVDGSLLIQDVANDLYLVPEIGRLDANSQKLLWAFMDDD